MSFNDNNSDNNSLKDELNNQEKSKIQFEENLKDEQNSFDTEREHFSKETEIEQQRSNSIKTLCHA